MTTLDHKTFLSQLSANERRALLHQRNLPGLIHLASHLGALSLSGLYIHFQGALWPMALVPHGILLIFLFTLLHETIHDTAFRSNWINRWAGRVCGFLLLLPPLWFRYFHFAHHRFTGELGRDPELDQPRPQSLGSYLVYLSGIPLWKSHITALVKNAFLPNRDAFVPPRAKQRIRNEARLYLGLYLLLAAIAITLKLSFLLWLWILPALIGQPFLRAYLLAEHSLCPPSEDMFENTRTTLTTRIIRWLAWNMPYHAEHHSYPAVPFFNLPRFHQLTQRHLKSLQHGYIRVHGEITRQFQSPTR